MQVPPSSWANPAAQTQQGLLNQRSSNPVSSQSTAKQLNPIEQSQKTGDRDANERYDGPMSGRSRPDEDSETDNSKADVPHDALKLPADDGEVSQIDISG